MSLTRPSNSVKDGSPGSDIRSGTVLANLPTTCSNSARVRPLTGVPITMSLCRA